MRSGEATGRLPAPAADRLGDTFPSDSGPPGPGRGPSAARAGPARQARCVALPTVHPARRGLPVDRRRLAAAVLAPRGGALADTCSFSVLAEALLSCLAGDSQRS